jgi:hypothetical protein
MKKYNELFITFALIFFTQGCSIQSDEQILRKEFNIPASAKTILFTSSPEKGGWFGREGLRIDATFQFNDTDFQGYKGEAEKSGAWQPLPIPKYFLMKMGGIKAGKEMRLRTHRAIGEPIPKEGTVYNPTEEQLYEKFVSQLFLDAKNGLYQCRAAGNDIMHEQKVIYKSLEKELNDFMFAVLDTDKKILKIKVSTNY